MFFMISCLTVCRGSGFTVAGVAENGRFAGSTLDSGGADVHHE